MTQANAYPRTYGAAPTKKVLGAGYTFQKEDINFRILFMSDVPVTALVPKDLDPGAITVQQVGAGQVTVAGENGVTLKSSTTLALSGQNAVCVLLADEPNVWTFTGDRG